MGTTEDYRIKLKEIADFAFKHGVNVIGIDNFKTEKPFIKDKNIQKEFIIACHDGFKIAQNLLILEIQKYQTLLRDTTNELKEIRRQRNKEKEEATQIKIKTIEQRLHSLSHIANGIAWQLIGGQIHIARRLHVQEKSSKYLDSSNIEHAVKVADEINKNPYDFALISDLTNFIQIGDLLVLHDKKIGIMELKEGKVNDQITDFFDSIEMSGNLISKEEINLKFDDKTINQAKRMLRQKERAFRVTDVINNDEGIDPVSGNIIFIGTPKVITEYYHKDLYKLQEVLEEKKWAYTVVDTCLHIGMYRDEGLLMTGLIEELIKEQTENFIIIDWLSITQNLSEPLFAKPFPHDFIIDILTGKVIIIMGINMDALIDTFNVYGLESRWLTEKETMKQKQAAVRKGLVVVNKKGIITFTNGQEFTISGGTISKILFDCVKPSSIAKSLQSFDLYNDAKK